MYVEVSCSSCMCTVLVNLGWVLGAKSERLSGLCWATCLKRVKKRVLSWPILIDTMPKHCSIPGCTSRSNKEECKGLSFYKLPTDNEERPWWLVSIKKPITVSPYTYVCSLHFKCNKKTSSNDVPTIFPWTPSNSARKSPTVRPFVPPEAKRHKDDEDLAKQL